MTPSDRDREKAREVIKEAIVDLDIFRANCHVNDFPEVQSCIAQAIADERERCAKQLDDMVKYYSTEFFKEIPEERKAKNAVAADLLREMLPRFANIIRDGGEEDV